MLFLAEAFTRPAMMHELAKIGFTQSYTYFTWRNTKAELEELRRANCAEAADYMRPNFFVNTPDILHEYLQHGGPAAFAIRAVLAATLSPSWGVYSGYELFETTAVRPGSEEYLDSEKYQLRPRDFAAADAGRTLAPAADPAQRDPPRPPGAARAAQPAAALDRQRRDPRPSASATRRPATPSSSCAAPTRAAAQAGWTSLDLPALGLDWGDRVAVRDLLTGADVRLGPVQLRPARPGPAGAHPVRQSDRRPRPATESSP